MLWPEYKTSHSDLFMLIDWSDSKSAWQSSEISCTRTLFQWGNTPTCGTQHSSHTRHDKFLNFIAFSIELLKTPDDRTAWDYYAGGTLSIEILKDDNLHKLYFRCKDKVRR